MRAFHFATDLKVNGEAFTFDQAFGLINRCFFYVLQRQTLRDRSVTHINYMFNMLLHMPYTR